MPLLKKMDLTGRRFGRLVALKRTPDKKGKAYWVCQCDCGKKHITSHAVLLSGDTKSCGCLKSELTKKRTIKHGLSKHRLYSIYNNMIKRCENEDHSCYENYGGRGIKICREWREDFLTFYKWAYSNGYKENLTIDRIDNNKGYSPDNCRWVTKKEQQNHRRDNHVITYKGETHTLTEWSRILGISNSTLRGRLKYGWSVEEALSVSPNCGKRHSYNKRNERRISSAV